MTADMDRADPAALARALETAGFGGEVLGSAPTTEQRGSSARKSADEPRDITKNEAFLKELEEMKIMSTPVIVIDGETVVGFKKDRLDELLGL